MEELTNEETSKILEFLNGKAAGELTTEELKDTLEFLKTIEPQSPDLRLVIQKMQQIL